MTNDFRVAREGPLYPIKHGDPASLDLSFDDLERDDEKNRRVSDVGLAYFPRVNL